MDDRTMTTQALWMAVLVAAAVFFSFALACGMPFAALGALAALAFRVPGAIALAITGWLANQAIGFGVLGYPLDAMTIAWGVALGFSAVAAVVAAKSLLQRAAQRHRAFHVLGAFLAAWAAQQATVFIASLVLGGTLTAFAASVVWFIFWTNALAFALLIIMQAIGTRIGLANRPWVQAFE